MVLYLSQFTTEADRARTFGVPMIAIPLSVALGSPLSGWLLSMMAPAHLAPWRWLLIAEAIPALLFGLAARGYFPDQPQQARWLSAQQVQFLHAQAAAQLRGPIRNDWTCCASPCYGHRAAVVLLAVWVLRHHFLVAANRQIPYRPYTPGDWLDQRPALARRGAGHVRECRTFGSHQERYWHVALPALLGAVATVAAWQLGAGTAALLALMLLGLGLGAAQGAFWSIPTRLLTRSSLAVAAVMINLLGSAGGLVMPHLIGYGIGVGGGPGSAALLIAAVLAGAAGLTLLIRTQARRL